MCVCVSHSFNECKRVKAEKRSLCCRRRVHESEVLTAVFTVCCAFSMLSIESEAGEAKSHLKEKTFTGERIASYEGTTGRRGENAAATEHQSESVRCQISERRMFLRQENKKKAGGGKEKSMQSLAKSESDFVSLFPATADFSLPSSTFCRVNRNCNQRDCATW